MIRYSSGVMASLGRKPRASGDDPRITDHIKTPDE